MKTIVQSDLKSTVLARAVEELDQQGFTMLPGFVDRHVTAAVRDTIDRAIAAGRPGDTGTTRTLYRIMHPYDDPIMASLAADARLAEIARACLRCVAPEDLRLRQQMFMKTTRAESPLPPPKGGHVDSPFLPRERLATPRQTYVQFFIYCSDVATGGGAVYVSPRSHLAAYELAAQLNKDADRELYAPSWVGQIKLPPLVEVTGWEGDLIVFDPMCVHSGSDNVTNQPRYVYHCSYYDAAAAWIGRNKAQLCDPFPVTIRESLPPEMKTLIECDKITTAS